MTIRQAVTGKLLKLIREKMEGDMNILFFILKFYRTFQAVFLLALNAKLKALKNECRQAKKFVFRHKYY